MKNEEKRSILEQFEENDPDSEIESDLKKSLFKADNFISVTNCEASSLHFAKQEASPAQDPKLKKHKKTKVFNKNYFDPSLHDN